MRKGGGWRPIRAGEFILGYEDEEGALPSAPPPDELSCNGTFLAYRKLYQDVAGFRAMLAAAAKLYPGNEDLLAAKIVGRWRDGTPLDLSAAGPDPAIAGDEMRNNAFTYGGDANGARCPIGSHIRRVNPRDSLPFQGKLVNRHRLIRRGIPYGEPLPPGAAEDGADRGVLFMCLQASIARQFEFVQSQWLGQGNTLGLGEDQDVLFGPQDGQAPRKMTIPGRAPVSAGPALTDGDRAGWRVLLRAGHQRPALSGRGRGRWRGVSLVSELEQFGGRLAADVERFVREGMQELERHVEEHPQPLFALLRRVRPVLLIHDIAIVTRYADVVAVLSNDATFGVEPYGTRMRALAGDFILGLDDSDQYERAVSILRLAAPRTDVPRLAAFAAETSETLVAEGASDGRIDVRWSRSACRRGSWDAGLARQVQTRTR